MNNKMKSIGGNKFKRMKKGVGEVNTKLILKDKEQIYGQAIKLLGNSRIQVKCLINKNGKQIYENKIGVIRGSMRKRQWINIGDILILSEREFEKDGKMDVIYVYSKEHKYQIIQKENLKFNNETNNAEDIVEFIDDEDNYHIEEQREYTETPWFLSNNNSSSDEDIIDSNNKKTKSNKIDISTDENTSKKNKIDDDEIDLI